MWCGAAARSSSDSTPAAAGVDDDALWRMAPWHLRAAARVADAVEWCSWQFMAFLRKPAPPRRPGLLGKIVPSISPSRKLAMLVVLLLAGIGMSHEARAAGTLDTIANSVQTTSATWLASGLGLALKLASVFLFITGVVHFSRTYIRERSVPAAGKAMLDFGMSVALPWVVIFSLTTAPSGSLGVLSIASQVGAAYGLAPITPSGVLQNGTTIATKVLQNGMAALNTSYSLTPLPSGSLWSIITGAYSALEGALWSGIFAAIIIVLLFITWIAIVYVFFTLAVELVLVTMEAYIILPLGAWTAAFQVGPMGGFAGNFWGAVIAAIIRFLVIWALVAIATPIANLWPTQIANMHLNALPTSLSGLGGYVSGAFKGIASVCIDAFVVKTLFGKSAQLAEAVMSGRSALGGSGGELLGAAGGAAVGAVHGGITGGPSGAAAGAVYGGMSGVRGAASSALIARMRGGGPSASSTVYNDNRSVNIDTVNMS